VRSQQSECEMFTKLLVGSADSSFYGTSTVTLIYMMSYVAIITSNKDKWDKILTVILPPVV